MTNIAAAIEAFHASAAQFCDWCEGAVNDADREVSAASWLARLHSAALALPPAEPDNEEGLPDLPEEGLAAARRNLAPFIGHYYRFVFDPDPSNTDEPVMGDIGDDLLDTYKDIKAGCLLYGIGRVQKALWHWSYMHRLHWGKHAVGALAALHAAQQSRSDR